MPATVALTFDYHPQAFTIAKDILAARNLIATYYPDPTVIGTAGHVTKANLTLMKYLGWEIGAYTGVNMATLVVSDRDAAHTKLKALTDLMAAQGFPVETIAPNQRAWNDNLVNMIRGRFKGVRVCADLTTFQQYPIPEPLDVKQGGTASWSSADSASSLSAQLDSAIASGGLWVPVIHKVGPIADAFTVSTTAFIDFMDYLKTKRDNGDVRVVRFVDALNPP